MVKRLKVSLEDQELLAAYFFGDEWTRAKSQTGRRAVNRRRHLRTAALTKALKVGGARCKSCIGYRSGICDTHSDFHGNQKVDPEGICLDYSPR